MVPATFGRVVEFEFISRVIMGEFSYGCAECGGKSQFDWTTPCLVELALKTGATLHVAGYYDGYGSVTCRVGDDQQCSVYPDQFAHACKYWDGKGGGSGPVQITASKIWCNGSHGQERNCVPCGTDVLDRIPAESYDSIMMLRRAPKDDLREPYDAGGMKGACDMALPGMMLGALLGPM